MAVVAVAGDDAVAGDQSVLHAHDYRFLADIQVAETTDQAHAVHLSGLLFEAADQQHLAVVFEQLFGRILRGFVCLWLATSGRSQVLLPMLGGIGHCRPTQALARDRTNAVARTTQDKYSQSIVI